MVRTGGFSKQSNKRRDSVLGLFWAGRMVERIAFHAIASAASLRVWAGGAKGDAFTGLQVTEGALLMVGHGRVGTTAVEAVSLLVAAPAVVTIVMALHAAAKKRLGVPFVSVDAGPKHEEGSLEELLKSRAVSVLKGEGDRGLGSADGGRSLDP